MNKLLILLAFLFSTMVVADEEVRTIDDYTMEELMELAEEVIIDPNGVVQVEPGVEVKYFPDDYNNEELVELSINWHGEEFTRYCAEKSSIAGAALGQTEERRAFYFQYMMDILEKGKAPKHVILDVKRMFVDAGRTQSTAEEFTRRELVSCIAFRF